MTYGCSEAHLCCVELEQLAYRRFDLERRLVNVSLEHLQVCSQGLPYLAHEGTQPGRVDTSSRS